ncbi:hypothetical protein BJY04DRAFT_163312 [Aspergillus karnatakaensis]|uniref:uncharacterized protein n=1 Tax=Aspergillus karnatakaensis TaxID=1810916 RepID=UPI003CCCCBF2
MPALIESSSENRRPRRPSITQQLQRMFKASETRRNGSHGGPSSTDAVVSHPYHSNPSETDNGSSDYATYGPSDISSTGHSRNSHSSVGSKATGLNNPESRHSSLRSFQLEPQQPAKVSSVVDGPLQKQEETSSTANHTFVQKQDRRATKRLEAERQELEKRLLKLEEAERTGDVSVLRRESRRLTKKQPFGSSSRSSSASGDESRSRPPSRLSSLFSSARRRSRSRGSSVMDGVDSAQNADPDDNVSNSNTLPTLSSTLPERLSTAISKELAARKNALLVSPEQSTQTLKPPQSTTGTTSHASSSQLTIRNGHDVAPFDSEQSFDSEQQEVTDGRRQADLDRALFTASLTSKKRTLAPSQLAQPSTPDSQATKHEVEGDNSSEVQNQTPTTSIEANPRFRPAITQRGGMPVSILTRASTDGLLQRHQKTFKSSPLAESHTVNGDDASTAPRKTTTMSSPAAATGSRTLNVTERATRSDLSVTSSPGVLQTLNRPVSERKTTSRAPIPLKSPIMESRTARALIGKIPAPKSSQLAPSALLMKPRFYNSLSKVTDPPSDTQTKVTLTLVPSRRDREPSPSVPPKSPKRNNRALSQSPDSLPGNRLRPNSALSLNPSQDSDSDYNTADETASVVSMASDRHDPAVPKARRAADSARALPKKAAFSDNAPVIATSSGTKTDTKKTAKKMRPIGRDQLVAKLFIICCRCKFWHDMPSEVYASLTVSDPLSAALDEELAAWEQNALSDRLTASTMGTRALHESLSKTPKPELQQKSLRTRVTADPPAGPVKCCWCDHHMSKQCCQGWTTVVQMRQRHH